MKVKPLGDRVVIRRFEASEKTTGGIILPDAAKNKPQKGKVLAIGPGTKDGVTVAKEIELEDKYENMGARMVKEVASKTSDVAGDGTTTATVLAEAIFNEGLRGVVSGANPMLMKRGIERAVEEIVAKLKGMSKEVKK